MRLLLAPRSELFTSKGGFYLGQNTITADGTSHGRCIVPCARLHVEIIGRDGTHIAMVPEQPINAPAVTTRGITVCLGAC